MNVNHYIGFDVHKKSIQLLREKPPTEHPRGGHTAGPSARSCVSGRANRTEPWHGAMEATLFSG